MSLSELYIHAFEWVETYIGGVLSYIIKTPVLLPQDSNFSVIFLGYTDLQAYLTFLISVATFVLVHVLLYKGFKYLCKFFSGVVYKW